MIAKLSGLNRDTLDLYAQEFVHQVILPNENMHIVEKMMDYKKRGFDVALVSGGLDIYLDKYAKYRNIDYLICTKIAMSSSVCLGKIDGLDCMRKNKVTLLKKMIDISKYDLGASCAYSDDLRDKPIFNLVGHKFFVIEKSQKKPCIPKNFSIVQI